MSGKALYLFNSTPCATSVCLMLYNKVVHQKGKDLYVLFTRWGRIGDVGQFQQTPFPQLSDAIVEFKKIFRSKTGNDWSKLEQQPYEYLFFRLC